jgi:hypothetical protein
LVSLDLNTETERPACTDDGGLMMRIVGSMKWIMLVSGALTCTMFYAAIAPQAALEGTFGDTLQGPVAEIVVRNWGVLIGLMGAMLLYGAFNTAARPVILTVAGLSKVTFIALILVLAEELDIPVGIHMGLREHRTSALRTIVPV